MSDKKVEALLKNLRRPADRGSLSKSVERSRQVREWITIVGLFIAAGISAFQLHEMQKVYGPIDKQAIAAGDQAKASKDGVDLARQSFEVSQRPWLSPKLSIGGDLTIDQAGGKVRMNYSIKNNGNTVATEAQTNFVSLSYAFFAPQSGTDRSSRLRGVPENLRDALTYCREHTAWSEILEKSGIAEGDAVFPSETIEGSHEMRIAADDMKRAQKEDLALYPAIIVCLRYRSPFDKKPHRTIAAYTIDGAGKYRGNQFFGGISPSPGVIPAAALSLSRMSNAYAD